MKASLWIGCLALTASAVCLPARAAEQPAPPLERLVNQAVADYTAKLQDATRELQATRDRIAAEKKPLLDRIRELEDRAVALEAQVSTQEARQAENEDKRQRLLKDGALLAKNTAYQNTLAMDALKNAASGLLPGEVEPLGTAIATLQQRIESERNSGGAGAAEISRFLLERVNQQLGGYSVEGKALVAGKNVMVPGRFVYLGPEVFFGSSDQTVFGTVRTREGSTYSMTYDVPGWDRSRAAGLFAKAEGTAALDASGGKALRLQETEGTVWQHIKRGGVVAFLIIGVGLLALGIALHKLWELRQLRLDSPLEVKGVLEEFFSANPEQARAAVSRLTGSTAGLFAAGLRCLGKPKDVLEEQLYAYTLQQRLHFERRLPLLAVIATAAPLMGLLGTVMGMVKTFALITVFGTGNAAKLSSGISEVLVTTELGLAVAIPALVAHGFLSHRIQKKLSLLEQYAVEFLAAASEARKEESEVGSHQA
ncbi:hypothetical protein DB347_07695 [Opitutaceae bacterium EW11]|nr:hypothetical protein DB347_07695 [Opitutaceae bacterium EW11]